MPQLKMPGHIDHTLDFDDFSFKDHGFNYEIAKELSTMLLATTDIDDLRGLCESNENFDSTIGTGASMNWPVNNVSLQRTLLASHFSCYAQRRYSHCYLSIYEYHCLKTLLEEIKDDYVSSHREAIQQRNVDLLKQVCQEFAIEYAKIDPTFLMTVIKEAQE